MASTIGLEGLLEKSAGGGTITKTVGHFLCTKVESKKVVKRILPALRSQARRGVVIAS